MNNVILNLKTDNIIAITQLGLKKQNSLCWFVVSCHDLWISRPFKAIIIFGFSG